MKQNSIFPMMQASKTELIDRLVTYSDQHGNLLNKFTPQYIAQCLDIGKLHRISKIFPHTQNGIKIEEFLGIFASLIPHTGPETLFLAICLVDVFEEVQTKKAIEADKVCFSDFTDMFYERVIDRDPYLVLPQRQNTYNQALLKNKKDSPCVRYLSSHELPILSKSHKSKEKSLRNPLSQLILARETKKIISLSFLSPNIEIYTEQLKLWKQIKPKISKQMKKQFVILSVGYDEAHQRLGCVIKNVGLLFCEASDSFETEKLIEGVSALKIVHLKLVGSWVTFTNNSLTVWNISEEKPKFQAQIPDAAQINCFEEIKHLKKLAFSITLVDQSRELRIYDFTDSPEGIVWRFVSKVELSYSGCHSLHYNPNTQSLIRLGYHNLIHVCQVDRLSCQLIQVAELEGHRSIVTAVTSIFGTSVCVTGDDDGYVRLWDLTYMRCFQVVKLCRQIKLLNCVNSWLLFGDKRINLVPIDMPREDKATFKGYNTSFCDEALQKLYIFNHNSCLSISMATGELIEVFVLCEEQEEIICVQKLKKSFCIGTNRGCITHYDMILHKRRQYKVSEEEIRCITTDSKDMLIFMLSGEGHLSIWSQDQSMENGPKKSLVGLPADNHIDSIVFSQRDCIVALVFSSTELLLYDYENLKPYSKVIFSTPFTFCKFHAEFPLIFLVLEGMTILALQYKKEETKISIVNYFYLKVTCEENDHITHFSIGSDKTAYIGTYIGNFYSVRLDIVIDRLYKEKVPKFDERGAAIHRPVREKFKIIRIAEYTVGAQSERNVCQLPITSYRNLTKGNTIAHMSVYQENNFVSVLCSKGIFRIFQLNSLNCVGERRGTCPFPQKWQKMKANNRRIKENLIDTIKIMERVYNYPFAEPLAQEIDKENLDITRFIEQVADQHKLSTCTQAPPPVDQLLLPIVSLPIDIQNGPEIPRQKQPTSENAPLKYLEIEKRIRQTQSTQNEHLNFHMKLKDNLSHHYSHAAHLKELTKDDFFKPSYRENLERIPQRFRADNSSDLYRRIEKKYFLGESLEKSRSITNLNRSNIYSYKENGKASLKNIASSYKQLPKRDEKDQIMLHVKHSVSKFLKHSEMAEPVRKFKPKLFRNLELKRKSSLCKKVIF